MRSETCSRRKKEKVFVSVKKKIDFLLYRRTMRLILKRFGGGGCKEERYLVQNE